jgi:hypothetical protein
MFSDQSYFATTEKVGQALVDEIIGRASPTDKKTVRDRDIYEVDMGRIIGLTYDRSSMLPNKFVPTQIVRVIVERNNCSKYWRFNEVVSMYPIKKP